jgi:hypothetical protein
MNARVVFFVAAFAMGACAGRAPVGSHASPVGEDEPDAAVVTVSGGACPAPSCSVIGTWQPGFLGFTTSCSQAAIRFDADGTVAGATTFGSLDAGPNFTEMGSFTVCGDQVKSNQLADAFSLLPLTDCGPVSDVSMTTKVLDAGGCLIAAEGTCSPTSPAGGARVTSFYAPCTP